MDEKTVRLLIRMRLQNGRLPYTCASKVAGSPATGEVCVACGVVITDQQLAMEVAPRTAKGTQPIQFHVLCFELWNDERRKARERIA
jgi:hypothetical protein